MHTRVRKPRVSRTSICLSLLLCLSPRAVPSPEVFHSLRNPFGIAQGMENFWGRHRPWGEAEQEAETNRGARDAGFANACMHQSVPQSSSLMSLILLAWQLKQPISQGALT